MKAWHGISQCLMTNYQVWQDHQPQGDDELTISVDQPPRFNIVWQTATKFGMTTQQRREDCSLHSTWITKLTGLIFQSRLEQPPPPPNVSPKRQFCDLGISFPVFPFKTTDSSKHTILSHLVLVTDIKGENGEKMAGLSFFNISSIISLLVYGSQRLDYKYGE